MSLKKNFLNLNLKRVLKNSDSFDDRFCDNLCEEILQYLPLKDKLRLECVSKQFQRTVFRRVCNLDSREMKKALLFEKHINSSQPRNESEFTYLISIESLLKKCSNIISINVTWFHPDNKNYFKPFLQLINKYCNHLIEFKDNGKWTHFKDCNEYRAGQGQRL